MLVVAVVIWAMVTVTSGSGGKRGRSRSRCGGNWGGHGSGPKVATSCGPGVEPSGWVGRVGEGKGGGERSVLDHRRRYTVVVRVGVWVGMREAGRGIGRCIGRCVTLVLAREAESATAWAKINLFFCGRLTIFRLLLL